MSSHSGWTKKTEFGSGTAATVYIRKDAPLRRPGLNQELEEWRARGMKNPISEADIHELISATSPSVQRQMIYHVLRVLLDAPEFHLDTYAGKNSSFLKPPMPIEALPCGPDHITMRYMLGSMPIPGATSRSSVNRILSSSLVISSPQTVSAACNVSVAKNGTHLTGLTLSFQSSGGCISRWHLRSHFTNNISVQTQMLA